MEKRRSEYTSSVEIRHGTVYVTRVVSGIEAPYTKWDLLSDGERIAYENTDFNNYCSTCGHYLATEADFAKHYVVSDVRYFNLGSCYRGFEKRSN